MHQPTDMPILHSNPFTVNLVLNSSIYTPPRLFNLLGIIIAPSTVTPLPLTASLSTMVACVTPTMVTITHTILKHTFIIAFFSKIPILFLHIIILSTLCKIHLYSLSTDFLEQPISPVLCAAARRIRKTSKPQARSVLFSPTLPVSLYSEFFVCNFLSYSISMCFS